MSELRPVGPRLRVAEHPLRMLGVEAGRRMAVVELESGDLLIHSPAELTAELRSELDDLGRVRHLVPASRLHGHLFMEQYATAYPEARLYAAPGLEQRRRDLSFSGVLGDSPEPAWEGEVDQAVLHGHRLLTEVLFLHRASRTLIVGDAVWNVTAGTAFSGRLWAGWREGLRPTPAFRLGFGDRAAARASIERVLGWDFDRILVGHGAIVETGGKRALADAYAWLGPLAASR